MRKTAGILAIAVTAFLAARPAAAQPVSLTQTRDALEITGGEAGSRWTLRYGFNDFSDRHLFTPQVVEAGGGRAYFSHGQWLRLIDVKQGTVIGRWRYPCGIDALTPDGASVRVQLTCTEPEAPSRPTFAFDPAAPSVPDWPYGALLLLRTPWTEGARLAPEWGQPQAMATASAARYRPVLENAVRRDPLSPFLRVALGRVLRALDEAGAGAMLASAVETGPADFYELFPLAASLEYLGERDASTRAFERGYRNYLERGYDPRLFTILISRLVLYAPFSEQAGTTAEYRPELVERLYRLVPYGEGAAASWKMHADRWEQKKHFDAARIWRERAADARAHSLVLLGDELLPALDDSLLVVVTACAACLLMTIALYVKYAPQRRLTVAIESQQPRPPRRFACFNIEYWSRRERLGFLAVAAAAWYATGLLVAASHMVAIETATPIGMSFGSFGTEVARAFLANRMRPTPSREVLLALSHQQSGHAAEAERLYRTLPGFPEAWNNLGVILQNAGRRDEATQAYEQALRLDPNLAEAKLNLGQPASTMWTELHRQYVPDRPMLAVPPQQRMVDAMRGHSPAGFYAAALLGPFNGWHGPPLVELSGFDVMLPARFTGPVFLVCFTAAVVVVLSILVTFASPRDVTEAPGRGFRALAVALPGLSPRWGALGTPALMLAIYVTTQIVLRWGWTSARLVTMIAMPGVTRAYGLSGAWPIERPYTALLYTTAAALVLAHIAMVQRART